MASQLFSGPLLPHPTMSLLRTATRARPAFAISSALAPLRNYAAPNHDSGGDPQKDIMRRVLYPGNIKNRPTPIGTWRPDVARALQRAIPSVQAHDTIERAWLLHKRHLRHRRATEAERKFAQMKKAMDVLGGLDLRLYHEANRRDDPRARSAEEMEFIKKSKVSEIRAMEGRIHGLFPRELRIPTETPSRTGWKYAWKPFHRPL